MALLQISEPDLTPAPHHRRIAVGIDLGTTHSLIAVMRHGLPEVLPNELGEKLLPSAVRYCADGKKIVGTEAKQSAAMDPLNSILSIKRLMGRGYNDVATHLPYQFINTPGVIKIETAAGIKTPIDVSADILAVLKTRAEATLATDVIDAVVTVPAYFDEAQRQATKDAARLAGLNVLRLLNEPTAAAIAYGLDEGVEGTYVIYDLGGGTFDVSLLKLTRGVFEVLATGGDAGLGGDDFDLVLAKYALHKANNAYSFGSLNPQDLRLLLDNARAAKENLSSQNEVKMTMALSKGIEINITLNQNEFSTEVEPLIKKTIAPLRRALRDAALTINDINGIVLVGGATRMPCIRNAVQTFFNQAPLNNIDPDQVVAIGAAIQADLLVGNRKHSNNGDDNWLLLDVIPLSLGVETMGGLVEKIIPRNASIPIARGQEFTTFKDGQTAIAIHVVQGERELATDCRSLARFELTGIPPMVAGAARLRVTYEVDADGLLSVSALETHSGVHACVVVKPSYGLEDEEIAQMLKSGFSSANEDKEARARRERQIEAQRLLEATFTALAADKTLLTDEALKKIESACQHLQNILDDGTNDVIDDAIKSLITQTDDFAAKRMNAHMREALSGKKMEEIENVMTSLKSE